jgi:flagellar hook-length control protein FliK
MSRVNFDARLGWMPRDPALPGYSLWDQVPQLDSFDQHLQQARSAAAATANDDRREPADVEPASQSRESPEDRKTAEPADDHSTGQTGDPCAAADSDVSHADPHAAPSPPDQPNVPKGQEDVKQPGNAPRQEDAAAADGSRPEAAKGRPTRAGNRESTAAAQPAASHKKTEESEEGSEAKEAAQAGVDLAATSAAQHAAEQPAEDLPASSQAQGPRAGKTGKAAAGVPKSKGNVEGDVPVGHQAAETADEAAKLSAEAAQASDKAPDGTVLQKRTDDAQPATGTARRGGVRSGPRGVNDARPADDEAGAAAAKDPPRLASELRSATSEAADLNLPAKGGDAPAQTSQANPANPMASVQPTGGVIARSATAASRPSGSSASAEDSPSDTAERAQFAQRVARALAAAADRGGAIRLRLHPPELGSVRLELTVRNGAMTARLETETQSARAMLLDNLPALRERLAEHQIKVERFDVDWQAQPQGNLAQGSGEQPRWQPSPAPWRPESAASSPRAQAVETPAHPPTRPGAETSFDVVI